MCSEAENPRKALHGLNSGVLGGDGIGQGLGGAVQHGIGDLTGGANGCTKPNTGEDVHVVALAGHHRLTLARNLQQRTSKWSGEKGKEGHCNRRKLACAEMQQRVKDVKEGREGVKSEGCGSGWQCRCGGE